MRRSGVLSFLVITLLVFGFIVGVAQDRKKQKQRGLLTKKYAVMVNAEVQDTPPRIKLYWPKVDDCLSYVVYRRFLGH